MRKYEVKVGDRYYVRRGGVPIEVEVTKIRSTGAPVRCWWEVTSIDNGYRFEVFFAKSFRKSLEEFS